MARKQHSLIGTRTTRRIGFARAQVRKSGALATAPPTLMEGGWRSLACRRVSGAGVRAAYPADTPYSAGPAAESLDALRLSRPPRVGSASEATPVPEGLPQPGQPAEFEPESEAAAYGRSVGREELQIPDRFRYWSPRTATLGVYRWPRSRSAEGGTRPRLRGSWRGADPSQPLVVRSHSRSIPATCTLAAGSSRGR